MLSPVSATEVDAPVAVKPLEGSPVTADATSSDTELKVCDEAGFVADNEARNVTEYVAEAGACNEAVLKRARHTSSTVGQKERGDGPPTSRITRRL